MQHSCALGRIYIAYFDLIKVFDYADNSSAFLNGIMALVSNASSEYDAQPWRKMENINCSIPLLTLNNVFYAPSYCSTLCQSIADGPSFCNLSYINFIISNIHFEILTHYLKLSKITHHRYIIIKYFSLSNTDQTFD